MPKTNRDRALKHLTHQPLNPDRSATTEALVPVASAAMLRSTVVAVDIKERMLSEEALKDSEARYRRLFENAQDGILILDAKTGSITDVNRFMVELLEYSRAELLEMSLWAL